MFGFGYFGIASAWRASVKAGGASTFPIRPQDGGTPPTKGECRNWRAGRKDNLDTEASRA
jgi:hypothetical protein